MPSCPTFEIGNRPTASLRLCCYAWQPANLPTWDTNPHLSPISCPPPRCAQPPLPGLQFTCPTHLPPSCRSRSPARRVTGLYQTSLRFQPSSRVSVSNPKAQTSLRRATTSHPLSRAVTARGGDLRPANLESPRGRGDFSMEGLSSKGKTELAGDEGCGRRVPAPRSHPRLTSRPPANPPPRVSGESKSPGATGAVPQASDRTGNRPVAGSDALPGTGESSCSEAGTTVSAVSSGRDAAARVRRRVSLAVKTTRHLMIPGSSLLSSCCLFGSTAQTCTRTMAKAPQRALRHYPTLTHGADGCRNFTRFPEKTRSGAAFPVTNTSQSAIQIP